MSILEIVVLIVVLMALIVDPLIDLWQAAHDITSSLTDLKFGVAEVKSELQQFIANAPRISDSMKITIINVNAFLLSASKDIAAAHTALQSHNKTLAKAAISSGINSVHQARVLLSTLTIQK